MQSSAEQRKSARTSAEERLRVQSAPTIRFGSRSVADPTYGRSHLADPTRPTPLSRSRLACRTMQFGLRRHRTSVWGALTPRAPAARQCAPKTHEGHIKAHATVCSSMNVPRVPQSARAFACIHVRVRLRIDAAASRPRAQPMLKHRVEARHGSTAWNMRHAPQQLAAERRLRLSTGAAMETYCEWKCSDG